MNKAKLKEQINLVINLSDIELTSTKKSLLNRGLNFCPSPKNVNLTQLKADTFHLERNMSWANIYHGKDSDSENERLQTPFDEKRRKDDMPRNYPDGIKTFSDSVASELMGAQHRKVQNNMSKEDSKALEELQALQDNGTLLFQPGDKNAGFVVMNREDYIAEGNCQLNETYLDKDGNVCNYYQKVEPQLIETQYQEIKTVIDEGHENGYITDEMHKILLPPKAQCSKLYLLPEVHKEYDGFPKCRPIIASSGSNTERISWFADQQVKDYVKKLDSYLEDTPDLLFFGFGKYFQNYHFLASGSTSQ